MTTILYPLPFFSWLSSASLMHVLLNLYSLLRKSYLSFISGVENNSMALRMWYVYTGEAETGLDILSENAVEHPMGHRAYIGTGKHHIWVGGLLGRGQWI